MGEYKRDFVDENPYLCYAETPNTSASSAGGGGSIPIASADTLGGIKVGENLSITEGGVLSASGGGGGSSVLLINATKSDGNYVLDQKAKTIFDAYITGTQCIVVLVDEMTFYFTFAHVIHGDNGNYTFYNAMTGAFEAGADDDYPINLG